MAQAFDWVAGRAPALQEIFELDENGNIISSSVPLGDNVFSPAPVASEPEAPVEVPSEAPAEEPVIEAPVEEPAPVVEAPVEEPAPVDEPAPVVEAPAAEAPVEESTDEHNTSILGDSPAV
jgi:outer membrane biosynthesis protein TonB